MPLEKLLERLRNVGLSDVEQEILYITDEPKIPNFITLPNDFAKEKYLADDSYGQGYHLNEVLSRVKSLAEYLERLCLDNPLKFNLIRKPYFERNELIDPSIFCCYSEEQIGNHEDFKIKARSSEYLWFEVLDVLNKKNKMLPAQTIFLRDIFNEEFQLRNERISTGAALGEIGTERAFNSGLLEVIERDACIYAYLSRKDIPRIVNFEGEIKELEEYLIRYNLESFVFDASSDLGVPTIISVVVDRTGIGPAVEVGSAADLRYDEAIYKSLFEAVQCRRYARLFNDTRFPNGPPNEMEIFSLDHRFVYWHSLNRIEDLAFWLKTENKVNYHSLKSYVQNRDQILQLLRKRYFNIFVVDITLPEIRNMGFEVKKVIVPELHPLYLDERAKSLYSVHYGTIKDDKTLKPHPLT